jgi:signal transduction histidine kinase
MLYEFLLKNQTEILSMTTKKYRKLTGFRPSSELLKKGLPLFYKQLTHVLERGGGGGGGSGVSGLQPEEVSIGQESRFPSELTSAARLHGEELLRLGYTLSLVVHAYGSMCQSITELATKKNIAITSLEFHRLNKCLDIAIAGAVTGFEASRNTRDAGLEIQHLGFLTHELRNALTSASVSLELIKRGTVGFGGSTGQILERSLKTMEALIDRSLTEVRLRVDPKPHIESNHLLQLVDQILTIAEASAREKQQILEVDIDPTLVIRADYQLLYSALSNLIQNALKFTHAGGKIQIRAREMKEIIVIEVEDECGGLSGTAEELFKPFEQMNQNRTGLGLGLPIALRAMMLNRGSIEALNLHGKGCIFKMSFPKRAQQSVLKAG